MMCVSGRETLYDYLASRSIPVNKCGKLIVCTDSQDLFRLKSIQNNAEKNSVTGLKILSGETVRQHFEPLVHCQHALWVPMTGVFNSHMFGESLQADCDSQGVSTIYNCDVVGAQMISFDIGSQSNVSFQPQSSLDTSIDRTHLVTDTGSRSESVAPSTVSDGWKVATTQGDIHCDHFINSTGLFAPFLAKSIDSYNPVSVNVTI